MKDRRFTLTERLMRALMNPREIQANESKLHMPIERLCSSEYERQIYKLMFPIFGMKINKEHKAVNKRKENLSSLPET